MNLKKSGQLEITFNWVYILIAGAIILLFFVGLVVKQKASAEERLSVSVIQIMDSIFTAASAADKTRSFIDTSGLVDYTLSFTCQDGISQLGIKGKELHLENAIDPLFAPAEIQSAGLILWSWPFNMPFKVIDFLFIIPVNTKFVLSDTQNLFAKSLLSEAQKDSDDTRLKIDVISWSDLSYDLEQLDVAQDSYVRLIDFDGNLVADGMAVPSSLMSLDDNRVTAVRFIANGVLYFQKQGDHWTLLDQQAAPLLSLVAEKDAALYAALFAADGPSYQCNLQKALRRLRLLTNVYEKKLEAIETYYQGKDSICAILLSSDNDLRSKLLELKTKAELCNIPSSCEGIVPLALDIQRLNQELQGANCLTLY